MVSDDAGCSVVLQARVDADHQTQIETLLPSRVLRCPVDVSCVGGGVGVRGAERDGARETDVAVRGEMKRERVAGLVVRWAASLFLVDPGSHLGDGGEGGRGRDRDHSKGKAETSKCWCWATHYC